MIVLEIFGWCVSSFGPLALAVWSWRLARRLDAAWLSHLLFLPSAIAVYESGAHVLFFAAGVPDGDSVEGYALLPAFGLLLITLLIHAAALAVRGLGQLRRRLDVR